MAPPHFIFIFILLIFFKTKNGIGSFIRIGREIQCLPYSGFFLGVVNHLCTTAYGGYTYLDMAGLHIHLV